MGECGNVVDIRVEERSRERARGGLRRGSRVGVHALYAFHSLLRVRLSMHFIIRLVKDVRLESIWDSTVCMYCGGDLTLCWGTDKLYIVRLGYVYN